MPLIFERVLEKPLCGFIAMRDFYISIACTLHRLTFKDNYF